MGHDADLEQTEKVAWSASSACEHWRALTTPRGEHPVSQSIYVHTPTGEIMTLTPAEFDVMMSSLRELNESKDRLPTQMSSLMMKLEKVEHEANRS